MPNKQIVILKINIINIYSDYYPDSDSSFVNIYTY